MARDRIPRAVLADELRQFVLTWREGEARWVSEDHSPSVMQKFEEFLGPKLAERVPLGTLFRDEERRDIYDVLWSYVESGVLRPFTGSPSRGDMKAWSALYLTAYGRSVLDGAAPLPEDITEFLRLLAEDAPRLDHTARFYVEQALRAFKARLYPPAAVMLGCAAEHTVEKLAEALVPKLPAASRDKLRKALAEGPISRVWDAFLRPFESHRSTVFGAPYNLVRTSQTGLDGLFLFVKRARDDSGHPAEVHLTENEARALLQVFVEHARYASIALDGIDRLPNG